MRKVATLLVILAAMSAKQADAVELLVRVADTIYATEAAVGTLVKTAGQVSSIRLAPHQEYGRRQVMNLLQAAMNYEAGARSAAYTCRYYAEAMVKMHPGDPRYGDVMKRFDTARDACFQHTRTARHLAESANNTANRYGLGGLLLPAVRQVRQAAEAAEELSRWIPRHDGIDPLMI